MQNIIDAVAKGSPFTEILVMIAMYIIILLLVALIGNGFEILYAEKKRVEINSKINLEVYKQVKNTDYKYSDNPEFYNNYTLAINEYASKSQQSLNLLVDIGTSISLYFQ